MVIGQLSLEIRNQLNGRSGIKMNHAQYDFLAELNSEPLKRVAELQRRTMAIGLVFVFLLMKCKLQVIKNILVRSQFHLGRQFWLKLQL